MNSGSRLHYRYITARTRPNWRISDRLHAYLGSQQASCLKVRPTILKSKPSWTNSLPIVDCEVFLFGDGIDFWHPNALFNLNQGLDEAVIGVGRIPGGVNTRLWLNPVHRPLCQKVLEESAWLFILNGRFWTLVFDTWKRRGLKLPSQCLDPSMDNLCLMRVLFIIVGVAVVRLEVGLEQTKGLGIFFNHCYLNYHYYYRQT